MPRQSEVHSVACFCTESDLKIDRAICVPADELAAGSRDAFERDAQRISGRIEGLADHSPALYVMPDYPRFRRSTEKQNLAWKGEVKVR